MQSRTFVIQSCGMAKALGAVMHALWKNFELPGGSHARMLVTNHILCCHGRLVVWGQFSMLTRKEILGVVVSFAQSISSPSIQICSTAKAAILRILCLDATVRNSWHSFLLFHFGAISRSTKRSAGARIREKG